MTLPGTVMASAIFIALSIDSGQEQDKEHPVQALAA